MILLFLLLGTVNAFNFSGHSTTINVLGQSGKVTIQKGTNVVTMQMEKLYEVSNDKYIGTTGQDRHSVTAFATQDFTFTDLRTDTYKNISVDEFYFFSPIHEIGILDVRTMLINEAGTMGTDTEQWEVQPGDIKWNIELRQWSFLPEADSIEVHIEMKGKEPVGNITNSTAISLGGSTLQLSNRVVVDGEEVDMPYGYPRIETQGSKDIYIFRFPRFQEAVVYDPVLQFSPETSAGDRKSIFLAVVINTLLFFKTCL